MGFSGKKFDGGQKSVWLKKGVLYSKRENELVHEIFRNNMYPGRLEMEGLAKEIGRPFESVRGKFSAERQKYSDMYNDPLVAPNRFTADDLKVLRESFDINEWPD